MTQNGHLTFPLCFRIEVSIYICSTIKIKERKSPQDESKAPEQAGVHTSLAHACEHDSIKTKQVEISERSTKIQEANETEVQDDDMKNVLCYIC